MRHTSLLVVLSLVVVVAAFTLFRAQVDARSAELARPPVGVLAQTVQTTTADELLGIVRQASAEAGATLLTNADPDVGAEVLEQLAIDKAELVIEQMDSEPAARLMERVSTDKGVELIGVIPGAQSADIWSLMEKVKAGELMDEAPLDWAVRVVGLVSEERLIPRLPEVSPDRLWDMPLETLLDRLPNVPVMQLDRWNRPDVPDDLPAPTGTEVSDTLTTYNVPETRVSEWATVVSSPAPFDRIWARFTRALRDVKVTVENLPEQPLGTPQFPPDRKVNAFVNVGFENAQPEDVAVAAGMLFVEKSWLEANEVHKWSIEFNRFDEGANRWTPFQSKRVREDTERIFFAVVVPGFSTLAITGGSGPAEQVFDVKDLKITPATPFAGQEFTVSANVTNVGAEAAEYPANLWIDKSIQAVELVQVGAGETVPFTVSASRPEGVYSVRLERLIDEFQVQAAPEVPEVGDVAVPMWAGLVVGVVLVLGGGLALRRRGFDWRSSGRFFGPNSHGVDWRL